MEQRQEHTDPRLLSLQTRILESCLIGLGRTSFFIDAFRHFDGHVASGAFRLGASNDTECSDHERETQFHTPNHVEKLLRSEETNLAEPIGLQVPNLNTLAGLLEGLNLGATCPVMEVETKWELVGSK